MLDLAGKSRQRFRVNAPSVIRWFLVLPLTMAVHAFAAGPENEFASRVLVLANSRQPESVKLAEFYAEKRGIPKVNIIAMPMPESETISWRDFLDQIYNPLQRDLVRKSWIDATSSQSNDRLGRKKYAMMGHHIAYLVTCRGVPLRIANDVSMLNEEAGPKIGRALYKDEAAGEMTCLLRWDPGARLPFHMHPEIEQRSMHETYSEEGCTILAIYRKPNVFAKSAGF